MRLLIVFREITDPTPEQNEAVRRVFPNASLGYPGCFYLDGDFDGENQKMDQLPDWLMSRETTFTLD